MYWWNLRATKASLQGEPLGSRALLPYLLAFTALETAVIEFPFWGQPSESPGTRQWVLGSLSILLSVCGCYYVYRQNGGAKGARFLERFLVVGWVTGIRFIVFVFLALVVLFGLVAALPALADSLAIDLFFELGTPIFYIYLGRHVADLARSAPAA